MSQSSTPLDALFETSRTVVDQTIETSETINRQGLDLTRTAVKPLAGAVGDQDAEADVDDAFDTLEATQEDVLGEVQNAADRTIDASQDATEWGFDVLDRQVGRLQEAGDSVGESASSAIDTLEETTEEAADTAGDVVEEAAETAEEAGETVEDAADDLAHEVDATAEEFEEFATTLDEEFGDVDGAALEGLVDDGIETLSDLASAQADAVADAGGVSQGRAGEWITAAVDAEGEAVADLEGIGETYSDRLEDAGIRTQNELARTSSETVADVAQVDVARAAEWVQRAQEQA